MLLDDRLDSAPETEFPQVPTTRARIARICRACDKRFLSLAGNFRSTCVQCTYSQRHAREFAEHPELFPEGVKRECRVCARRRALSHFRVRSSSGGGGPWYLSRSCEECDTKAQEERSQQPKVAVQDDGHDQRAVALIEEMCGLNRRITRMRFEGRLREAQPLLAKVAELRYALSIDTDTVHGATRSQVLAGWTGLDGLGASIEAETP